MNKTENLITIGILTMEIKESVTLHDNAIYLKASFCSPMAKKVAIMSLMTQ